VIEEIEIHDLGVIAEARLEPAGGFTAVTGETGAGKTMLLTALELLLGGRADAGLVRPGAERALVEGRFADLPGSVVERVGEAGGDLDDGVLIVARTVPATGRSRAHLGGRSVPQGVLGELAEDLVTIHGQSDQTRLRSPSRQRDVVDTYGGHADLLARMRGAHARARDLEQTLARVRAGERTRELEIASLTSALAEIDDAEIQPGEDVALRDEAARLDNMEHLTQAAALAGAALGGDPAGGEGGSGAIALLEHASRSLARAGEHDPALATLASQLLDAAYLAADLEGELGRYVAALEADPDRLDAVHSRRARLAQLARTYGTAFGEPGPDDPPPGSSDAVLAWAVGARERLAELTDPGQDAEALQEALTQALAERGAVAAELTAARRTAGADLAAAVTAELHGLAMPAARVDVEVAPAQAGPTGDDAVTLVLTAYRGAAPAPLGVGASGGELSRVMLALEVVLAERHGRATTFVFDEVDAGIGGRPGAAPGGGAAPPPPAAPAAAATGAFAVIIGACTCDSNRSCGPSPSATNRPGKAPAAPTRFSVKLRPSSVNSALALANTANCTALYRPLPTSGDPTPLYSPVMPCLPTVSLAASRKLLYRSGCICISTFSVSNGWPTPQMANPAIVPATRSASTIFGRARWGQPRCLAIDSLRCLVAI